MKTWYPTPLLSGTWLIINMSAFEYLVQQRDPRSVKDCDLQNLGESQLPRGIAFEMDTISE